MLEGGVGFLEKDSRWGFGAEKEFKQPGLGALRPHVGALRPLVGGTLDVEGPRRSPGINANISHIPEIAMVAGASSMP